MEIKKFKTNNQNLIVHDNIIYFVSYETCICELNKNTNILKINKGAFKHSKTTTKYLNLFIDEMTNLTKEFVKSQAKNDEDTYLKDEK